MPARLRRLLVVAVVGLIGGVAAPTAAAADAPGCAAPASRLDYHVDAGTVFSTGHGEFSCSGDVRSVEYRVRVWYRYGPAFDYGDPLPASTAWIPLGDVPTGRTPVFSVNSNESATTCGQYLVRPEIRWTYPGSSEFTYADRPVNETPNCV